jgi:hypothetical protein
MLAVPACQCVGQADGHLQGAIGLKCCLTAHRIQRHGNRPIYVRDLPTHGKTMTIHLDVPRLKCLTCSKTFTLSGYCWRPPRLVYFLTPCSCEGVGVFYARGALLGFLVLPLRPFHKKCRFSES